MTPIALGGAHACASSGNGSTPIMGQTPDLIERICSCLEECDAMLGHIFQGFYLLGNKIVHAELEVLEDLGESKLAVRYWYGDN